MTETPSVTCPQCGGELAPYSDSSGDGYQCTDESCQSLLTEDEAEESQ
jgi:hypothetical protein